MKIAVLSQKLYKVEFLKIYVFYMIFSVHGITCIQLLSCIVIAMGYILKFRYMFCILCKTNMLNAFQNKSNVLS